MRWVFADPANADESHFRNELCQRIDAWWDAFASQTQAISDLFIQQAEWDLPDWTHRHLNAILPNLCWEYGPAVKTSGHRLVITPETATWARPIVDTILARAPQLTGWEFYPHRLAEEGEMAELTLSGRTGMSLKDLQVSVAIGDGRKVDLTWVIPGCRGSDDEGAFGAAFVATEVLLGERLMDEWVGAIDVASPPSRGLFGSGRRSAVDTRRLIPPERLKPTVDSLVLSVLDQLPSSPLFESQEGRSYAGIELGGPQEEMEDYPGRTDLLVATTSYLEMWQAAHMAQRFTSGCHSRHGEVFCYLKIETPDGPSEDSVERRGAIEEPLNDALVTARAGCILGGGTGLRYAYIDLAISDMQRGLDLVRTTLQEMGVPTRTWLLFFDDTWEREWVGIQPSTPPPPMFEEG